MSADELKDKIALVIAKGLFGLAGVPTGVTEALFALLRQTGLKHLDEITWEWISELGKDLQSVRARILALEGNAVTHREAISLFLATWDAVLRTTQQHKKDCLRRAFVHCWVGGRDHLRTNEHLLNLVARLDDLDLLVLAELGRRTQDHSPKSLDEMPNCGLLPRPEDFEVPVSDVTPEARPWLVEGSLRRLASDGIAIDAMAAATQALSGMAFADGASPAVLRPHFVVSQLGLVLIDFCLV
jgi:hypothetical protein